MDENFEEMTPAEHLEAAKELLKTIQDAAKDLQDLLDQLKPGI